MLYRVLLLFSLMFFGSVSTHAQTNNVLHQMLSLSSCKGTGKLIGGACWYLGAAAATCTATCTALSLTVDTTPMVSFAGSGGTNQNCYDIMVAIAGFTGTVSDVTTASGALGCCGSSKKTVVRQTSTTTAAASSSGYSRACPCK